MERRNFKESRLNNWVSLIFRLGIAISLALVVIGLIILVVLSGTKDIQPLFRLDQIPAAIVISIGILILLLTPILPVLISVVTFWTERNKLYLGISTTVLFFLILSLILALT